MPFAAVANKVLRGGIPQEHRRRINLKKPLHPLQQLNQKILNTEVGERDILVTDSIRHNRSSAVDASRVSSGADMIKTA
jgi:hypothetical protein